MEVMESKVEEQVQAPKADTPQPKEPDLVTRVSQFKAETPAKEVVDTDKFDFKELEAKAEKDPTLMEAYKSLQRGFNTKFQELAEIKKSLTNQPEPSNWTPERIQKLMNDPAFVQAAQQLAGPAQSPQGPIEEEYSALSDKEKQKLTSMEQELKLFKEQAFRSQMESQRIKQDQEARARYGDIYKPEAIDVLTADLLAGKVQATREHLHKVLDYEDAIKRAYELGRQDRSLDNQEKLNSTSYQGVNAAQAQTASPVVAGESSRDFWKRIAEKAFLDQGRK